MFGTLGDLTREQKQHRKNKSSCISPALVILGCAVGPGLPYTSGVTAAGLCTHQEQAGSAALPKGANLLLLSDHFVMYFRVGF